LSTFFMCSSWLSFCSPPISLLPGQSLSVFITVQGAQIFWYICT
jgi:hypothetical protein